MAYKRPEYVVRWSLSGFHSWRECPFRFKIERILRTGVKSSPPMERGDRVHKLLERYLKGERGLTYAKLSTALSTDPPTKEDRTTGERIPTLSVDTLAKRLVKFRPLLERGRKAYKKKILPALVEDGFAFNAAWEEKPITDDFRTTDWRPIWLSGKIDFAEFATPDRLDVIDWKTGSLREEDIPKYNEQLDLYALVSFLRFPAVESVYPRLAYLDAGEFYDGRPYERGEVPALIKVWNKNVKPMFADRSFRPTPNRWCGWCAYGQARGDGRCKY